ncbi:MAG: hypothetical protein JKY51_04760 [Opitutaceae bacterium]|nr:hypothetical protein [Opitutaceae bacterium]
MNIKNGFKIGLGSLLILSQVAKAEETSSSSMGDIFKNGTTLLEVRGRYEFADQEGRAQSKAYTVRTRLGFETASLHGFKALIEMEDVRSLGSISDYNPYPQTGRTVIADPKGTELNRLQLSYATGGSLLTLGRQRIILDGARFVGNVGWRQNEQTFDALSFTDKTLQDWTFFYSYVDAVQRIFGKDAPLPAQREFESDSHLANIQFSGIPQIKITAYGYFLDLENSIANSSRTIGMSAQGSQKITEDLSLKYTVEYAIQQDYADNPNNYQADYLQGSLTASWDIFDLGIGYELLGSDNGQGFKTPLATLHKFNGWADTFLGTPAAGLEDISVTLGFKLPHDTSAKIIYHQFESDIGGLDFGDEWDAVLSHTINEKWKALAKYANYTGGSGGFSDNEKFWIQVEFKK